VVLSSLPCPEQVVVYRLLGLWPHKEAIQGGSMTTHTYSHEGARVVLHHQDQNLPPAVIAMAADAGWAKIIADTMNQGAHSRLSARAKVGMGR
jgi:hypothetical protein